MADQGVKPEVAPSPERQAEALRTLMLNVADRVAFITRLGSSDKDTVLFSYGKAVEEVERIQKTLESGVPTPELRGTSWAVIQSGFIATRNSLVARKWIEKPTEEKKS